MLTHLNNDNLKSITTAFARIVPRRASLPVLGHLLFAPGENGVLKVSGTNLEEHLVLKFPGCVKSAKDAGDAFLVSFNDLRQLAKQLGRQDTASLSGLADGDFALCTILSGGQSTSSRLVTLSVADFPMPEPKTELAASIAPLDEFFQAYRRAAVCASTDDTRHVLNGVFWDAESSMLVGTDGRRLAMVAPPQFGLSTSLVLPKTRFLAQQQADSHKEAKFSISGDPEHPDFVISCAGWEYRTRTVEGTYPNYRQVVPDSHSIFLGRVRIADRDVELLEKAVDRLVPRNDHNHGIVLYARPGCVALVGSAVLDDSPAAGDIHLVLPNSICEPESTEVVVGCINAGFLRDCVRRSGFKSLRVSEGKSPWLCEGDDGLSVIMPLKIDDQSGILAYAAERLGGQPVSMSAPTPVDTATAPEVETIPFAPATTANAVDSAPQPKAFPAAAVPSAATTHKEHHVSNTPIPIEPIAPITPATDPIDSLVERIDQVQEQLRLASLAVRDIKRSARDLDRELRIRDKQLAAREREFEKSARLITRLQEAIAA